MATNRTRTATIAIASALLGAGGVLWLQSDRRRPPKKPVREEFVPAQDISLNGRAGMPLGHLDVSDGLVTLYLYAGSDSFISVGVYSDSSRVYVNCEGNGESTGVIVGLNGTAVSDTKKGHIFGSWTDLSKMDTIRNALLPSRGRQFDDDWVIPSEDLHLQNRKGWVFASIGLAANGDPGIALADARGTVRATWFERKQLENAESDWWDVAVFDKAGVMRMSLQLRSNESPNLVLYADDISTQHVLDFGLHKLTPMGDAHPSALAYLPSMQIRPRGPIQLADNRGRKLWSGP